MTSHRKRAGFTLAEVVISMGASTIMLCALVLGCMGIQRALHNSERYATRQADQRRLLDYLSRDLRRAVGIAATVADVPEEIGSVSVVGDTALRLTLPAYYQGQVPASADYDQALPVVVTESGVTYGSGVGAAPSVTVSIRKAYLTQEKSVCFLRKEAEHEEVIVRDAEDLDLTVTVAADGRSCRVSVAFRSPYSKEAPLVGTYDRVLLRNLRTDSGK